MRELGLGENVMLLLRRKVANVAGRFAHLLSKVKRLCLTLYFKKIYGTGFRDDAVTDLR